MTARRDEELLQAALDGTLSDAEAARLRERVAQEPALRARADELERLADAVGSLGPSEPPLAFADRVMNVVTRSDVEAAAWWRRARWKLDQLLGRVPGHLQQEAPSSGGVRWNAGLAGGGDIVAKKALWAVAGIAVIAILAVVYFTGIRTVDQGAQGTIGGAERYRGAQPAAVGVKEGNAQKFFQTDTFDRLIKDKHVLKLLADREVCELLAGTEVEAALRNNKAALQDEAVEAALADPDVQAALADEPVAAALDDADVQAALLDETVMAALKGKAAKAALQDAEVQAMLGRAGVERAMLDAEFVEAALAGKQKAKLAENAEFAAALNNGKFKALLEEDSFMAALKDKDHTLAKLLADETFEAALTKSGSRFMALIDDETFEAALNKSGRALMGLFEDDGFMAALKAGGGRFRALLGEEEFMAALKHPDFRAVIGSDPDFQAALRDTEAMAAELRKRR